MLKFQDPPFHVCKHWILVFCYLIHQQGQEALLRSAGGSTPDHLWGLIGTRPAVSYGQLYTQFIREWTEYTDGSPLPEVR